MQEIEVFMSKFGKNIYKRFALSFLLVLFLPVSVFMTYFLNDYRHIYEEAVTEQAQHTLDSAAREIESNVENLDRIVSYNSQMDAMSDAAIKSTHTGLEIKSILAAQEATNAFIGKMHYYNALRPDDVFTSLGTYSLEYYIKEVIDCERSQDFLQILNSIDDAAWLRMASGKQAYSPICYIKKTNSRNTPEWWIFFISQQSLLNILDAEAAETVFYSQDGEMIVQTGCIEDANEKQYEIVSDASVRLFYLTRNYTEKTLFLEVNQWQRSYMLIAYVLLLLGGFLIIALTVYNGKPFHSLLNYLQKRVENIPGNADGFEAVRFAFDEMEEKIKALRKRQKRNCILLQLLYSKWDDASDFGGILKKQSLFQNAEVYRAIIASVPGLQESMMPKMEIFLERENDASYEFRLVDLYRENEMVIIAGLEHNSNDGLEQRLLQIVKDIRACIKSDIWICVGDAAERDTIFNSYRQALLCREQCAEETGKTVIFYRNSDIEENKIIYPEPELRSLYLALIEMDFEKVRIFSEILVGYLVENRDNECFTLSLYYDILNAYHQAKKGLNADLDVHDMDVSYLKESNNLDSAAMIRQIVTEENDFIRQANAVGNSGEPEDNLISRVIEFIDENAKSAHLNVSAVAYFFNLSVSNLSHQFKAQTDRRISDYIVEKKFEHASELLLQTELSVGEIADRIGYTQASSFIKKFRTHYGMTPAEYRKSGGK